MYVFIIDIFLRSHTGYFYQELVRFSYKTASAFVFCSLSLNINTAFPFLNTAFVFPLAALKALIEKVASLLLLYSLVQVFLLVLLPSQIAE